MLQKRKNVSQPKQQRGKNNNNNKKVVAYDFKKHQQMRPVSHPTLHMRQVEQKLQKYLLQLKTELSPKHYLMVLEAVTTASHHQRLTDKVLIRHLKALHDLI